MLIATPRNRVSFLLPALLAMSAACLLHSSASAELTIADNGNEVIVIGATGDEYANLYNVLSPNYRLKWFNGERNSFDTLFSAIFEPDPDGTDVVHHFGLTREQFDQHVADLQGVAEMMQIEEFRWGNHSLFGYIAYQRSGPQWTVVPQMENDLNAFLEDYLPIELKVVNRTFGMHHDTVSTLYKADKTATVAPQEGMDYSSFKDLASALYDDGYRVTSMEVINGAYSPTFVPVFKKNSSLGKTVPGVVYSYPDEFVGFAEGSFKTKRPQWIALISGQYDSSGIAFPKYVGGFLGQAKIKKGIMPSHPTLTAMPKPLVQKQPSLKFTK